MIVGADFPWFYMFFHKIISFLNVFFGKIAHVNDIMLATELQCSATKTVKFFLTNSWLRWLSKAVISFLIWSLLLWFHAVRFEKVHR